MNYTRILFATLLLPVSGYGNTERIQQLKEEQFQKTLELKDLAKRISDADEYIHSCHNLYQDYLDAALTKKKEILGSAYSEEVEKSKIMVSNIDIVNNFVAALVDDKPFDYQLTRDLYDFPGELRVDALDSLKFMFVRAETEQVLISVLVTRYEACFHELIKINRELNALMQ